MTLANEAPERAPAVPKITYAELLVRLHDPTIPDEELRPYLTAAPSSGPLDPVVIPNPAAVEVSADEIEAASAIGIGNGLARWRRQHRFRERLALGERLPILVSEGDSWFQFPFLITDVIDHLGRDHLIWSLGAAGDTAENMVQRRPEYMDALRRFSGRTAAFLFSAAGNDIIGEDEEKRSSLTKMLRQNIPGGSARDHIDGAMMATVLARLAEFYRTVVTTIRADPATRDVPIVVHGYDYPFAFPFRFNGADDLRSPIYAARDQWLGAAFVARGIVDQDLRREILVILIDALYDMLHDLAGDSEETLIFVVDCRDTLRRVSDWADEIHGTDAGFALVAEKFRSTLREIFLLTGGLV
ncbi:hypothetical protein [Acuticoccus kandeliae]|uniref:hypothetical protein n=1 Tax=Acuticoccus kandeliae TaxID=2073160 RepID=UPI001300BD34|nr:hypothetical protein [Acuticoccus kandeliae]